EAVVDDEWPAMADQEAPSSRTSAALDGLFAVYEKPDLVAAVDSEQYGESLGLLNEVSADRRGRGLASHSGRRTVPRAVPFGGGGWWSPSPSCSGWRAPGRRGRSWGR